MRLDMQTHAGHVVLLATWCVAVTGRPAGGGGLLEQVVTGLEAAAGFFAKDFSSINVDGLFGIRLAQGTLEQSLQWCSASCPRDVITRLQRLNVTMGTMAARALPYIEAEDPSYYSKFLATIDAPYMISPKYHSLGDAAAPAGNETAYDEEAGDACLADILGSHLGSPACRASEACVAMMTRGGQAGYSVTHQLLYFIMAEKTGCVEKLEKKVKDKGLPPVKVIEQKLCGHIYTEAKAEIRDGRVEQLRQDLFMEQNLLCGILGFDEFFAPSFISMVLGWQNAGGCFPMDHSLAAIEQQLLQQRDQEKKAKAAQEALLGLLQEEARLIDQASTTSSLSINEAPRWKGRRLLREKVMENDCLAHKSGLGIGLLGVYQRHLLTSAFIRAD